MAKQKYLSLEELLATSDGRAKTQRMLQLSDNEMRLLVEMAPVFSAIQIGVPDRFAVTDLSGEYTYSQFKKLLNEGRQLESDGSEKENRFAVALWRCYVKAKHNFTESLNYVVYSEAVKRKNWRAACELLKMRVPDYKKSIFGNPGDDVMDDDMQGGVGGSLKVEIVDAGDTNANQRARLEAIDKAIEEDTKE